MIRFGKNVGVKTFFFTLFFFLFIALFIASANLSLDQCDICLRTGDESSKTLCLDVKVLAKDDGTGQVITRSEVETDINKAKEIWKQCCSTFSLSNFTIIKSDDLLIPDYDERTALFGMNRSNTCANIYYRPLAN